MATDDSNRPRYTRQNSFPNSQTPLASPDLESFQLQKQQQHYRHQLTQRPSVPNISSNSSYYTHNARPPPFAMSNSSTGTSSPTTDISPSHLLPKKRHTQNEPSLDTPLSFPMPPGFQEEQLRGPSIKGQQSLSSLRHQKESQGLNNVPGTGSGMGASIGLGHAPSRPPRHPSRADSQLQQRDVVPGAMNVRIPSSSSSILNNNYNNNHNNNSNNSSFPGSPVSMASMSSYTHSYQSQSQTHRQTSASNLRKKSSAGVGGGSRPSTADSATSATANTASVGGASGNAYSVVRENVIDEDEGDGDYGEVMYRDRDGYKDRGLGRDRERVEVTPWEFQALPEESVVNEFEQVGRMDTPSTAGTGGVFSQQQQQQQYQASASRPRSLKSSRASAASGSSSIVPPLPPTPSMSVGTSASATASTFSIPHSVSTSSMRASGAGAVISPSVATGPMDEVTPWDMYPVVESATSNVVSTKAGSIPAPVKAPSYTASNTSSINLASPVMSSLASPLNSSSVNLSILGMAGNTKILSASANLISPSVATGPMDEVTPWDMYPVPGASVVSGGGASGISGGGMSGKGYVERDRADSASGSAYSRDRAGSSLDEKEHLKEVKEEKKSKSGAFGKIKAAVKNAAAGGSSSSGNETKTRARRGSVSASGGASTKSLAASSSTGNSHTNSHNGATTPTPYIVGFPPQPPPVPPIPPPIIAASVIPSPSLPPPSTVVTPGTPLGKPRSLAQVAEDPVNSHSLSSLGSGSGASSRGTDGGTASSSGVTTPPNTPPMSGLASPPSLSPTRAYFGHASTNMNGSPKVGAAIYHSPSTSTLGSVLSRRSHQSQVGTNPGASGSAIDLSLSGGQYVHYKSSIPPTPISASTTTSFSHSGISHAHGAYAASTASGSSLGATATGPVEDVTPWEMYPVPTPVPAVPPMPVVPPTPTKEAVRKQRQRAGTAGSVVSALSGRSARSAGAGSNSGSPSIGGGVLPSALQSSGVHTHQGEAVVMGRGASRKSVPYSERSGGAGSGMHSAGGRASVHSSQHQQTTKTGPKEEVTPWELEERLPPAEVAGMIVATTDGLGQQQQTTLSLPLSSSSSLAHQADLNSGGSGGGVGGTAKAGGIRARGSMTLEQLEEVMPWELSAPPPPSPGLPPPLPPPPMPRAGENGHREEGGASMERTGHREKEKDRKSKVMPVGNEPNPGKQSMQATVSALHKSAFGGGGSTFADFGLRRRRSTGGGTASGRSGLFSKDKDGKEKKDKLRMSTSGQGGFHGISSSNAVSSSSPISLTGGISSANYADGLPAATNGNDASSSQPQFSTADRKILAQLKVNQQALDAQFKIKGFGHMVFGSAKSKGKKYHTHPKEEVPYPRSYDREVLDLDDWETLFSLDICRSPTWHVFDTPPTKVLEIGCGAGTWILHCARIWKETHFVGLDIVPLHPNLHNLGSSDLASRVTWVQHNFLETLPFQDEEFDFIHIKRIALGVPEDKWDSLLEEIARVMKPGGALEMIEEDLFFPGKQDDEDDEQPIREDDDSLNWRKSVSSDQRTYRQHHESIDATMYINGHQEAVVAAAVPSAPTDESHDSTADGSLSSDQVKNGQAISRPASAATYTPRSAARRSESMNRPSLSVNTHKTTVSPEAYTNIAAAQPSMFSSNVGLFGGIGYLASEDPLMEAWKKQKRERASTGHPEPASERVSFSGTVTITPKPKQKISPFLLRSMADDDCPTDPRDHTILAAVWTGMLGSRFINTSPLSLLTTYLDYHFKDVRTHPPLLYHYPPPYPKVDPHYDDGLWRQRIPAGESEYDIDDAKDTIRPSPGLVHPSKPRQSMAFSADPTTDPSPESEDHQVSMTKLLKNPSPYVTLDNARSDAYVPSHGVLDGAPSARPKTNLPKQTLNIDIRTLNLHLSIRAKEILACSEEMWEWVEEVQLAEKMKDEEKRFKGTNEHHLGGLSDSASISSSVEFTNSAILDMTREDFDALLLNFHIDMMDRVAVGHLLKSRYDWHIFPDPKEKNGGISSERKAYDTNCAKYDAWLAKKGQNAPTASSWRRSMDSRAHSGLVVVPPKHDTSETNSPTISTTDHSFADGHSISSTLIGSSTRSEHSSTQLVPPASPTATKVSPAPQQKMLSRAMRVFVAWKAT